MGAKSPKEKKIPELKGGVTADVAQTTRVALQKMMSSGAVAATPPDEHGKHEKKKDPHDGHTPSNSGGGGWKGMWKEFLEGESLPARFFRWFLVFAIFSFAVNEFQIFYMERNIKVAEQGVPVLQKMKDLEEPRKVQKKQESPQLSDVKVGSPVADVVYSNNFDCPTTQDVENGFAQLLRSGTHHDVPKGKTLVGRPGCFSLKTTNEIVNLEGSLYQLAVPDPATPGNFYKCGEGPGMGEGDKDICKAFLAMHSGLPVRVIIKNNGVIKMEGK